MGLARAALAVIATLAAAAPAQGGSTRVKSLTPISDATPPSFMACPFDAPPPFEPGAFQPADTAVEPHLAIDPRRPHHMAAAWMQDFAASVVVAYTHNGGRTWRRSIPQNLSKCTGTEGTSADPRLAYGADGTLYLSTMRNVVLRPGRTVPDNEVAVSRSQDGGASWSDPVVVQGRDSYNDYPFVATDPEDPGRVYVTFTKATEPIGNALVTMFARSDDGGRSFSPPRPIYRSTDAVGYYSSGNLVTQKDGRILSLQWVFDGVNYLPTPDVSTSKIRALTSRDGGDTWTVGLAGEQSSVSDAVDPESGEVFQTGGPHVAPAPDGSWYVTWQDFDGNQRSRMLLVRGRPDGTWESPREILPWAPRAILFPMAAVRPDGTVGVIWYDTGADRPDDGMYVADAYFATVPASDAPLQPLHLAGPMNLRHSWPDARTFSGQGQRFLGDYMGMVAQPKGFVGALVLTAPVAKLGMSQLFAAEIRDKEAAKKRKAKRKPRKASAKKKRKRGKSRTRTSSRP